MSTLDTPLSMCLGKAAVKRLGDAGLETVRDLLYRAPRRYYTWGNLTSIAWLREGEEATLLAEVVSANLIANRSGQGVRLLVDVTDGHQALTCTFFAKSRFRLAPHQRLLRPGATVLVSGKVSVYRGKLQMVQPEFEELEDSSPEAAARRAGRPIPIYSAISGLPSWKVSALVKTVLETLDPGSVPEVIPAGVRERYALLDSAAALQKLHDPQVQVDWESAKRTLAWEEALTLQTALLASRVNADGESVRQAHPLGDSMQMVDQLIAGLPFELTDSQKDAWKQIAADLASESPMQRLLQADVGAGKTIIALMALLSAVEGGYQGALLAPTEVLARQHFASLSRLLEGAGVEAPLHLLTGKRSGPEKDAALAHLAAGEPGIVVGTHALFQEGVAIPNLALLVVDEQHRFGVAQRERLREAREATPHLLVMTATPIPRTIAMTVFGDLDVTMMKGMPPGRKPVQTHLVSNQNKTWMERLWQRAREEVEGGGRVYVVCPRIDPGTDAANETGEPKGDRPSRRSAKSSSHSHRHDGLDGGQQDLFSTWDTLDEMESSAVGSTAPDDGSVLADVPAAEVVADNLRGMETLAGIEIGLAHGRRKPEENAQAFADFASGKVPILVATTVVEVGVDVPEATLMIVLGSQRFGLSQLHQLRGRVGRSDRESMCLLVHAPTQSPVTQKRLEALAKSTDGFVLAETDLTLRSEGDVLGGAQSGRLSGLRFLSVRKDSGIIGAARSIAEQVLHEDPGLRGHPDLALAVNASMGEDVVWLERN